MLVGISSVIPERLQEEILLANLLRNLIYQLLNTLKNTKFNPKKTQLIIVIGVNNEEMFATNVEIEKKKLMCASRL